MRGLHSFGNWLMRTCRRRRADSTGSPGQTISISWSLVTTWPRWASKTLPIVWVCWVRQSWFVKDCPSRLMVKGPKRWIRNMVYKGVLVTCWVQFYQWFGGNRLIFHPIFTRFYWFNQIQAGPNVMDCQLPVIGGWESLKLFKRRKLLAIITTGVQPNPVVPDVHTCKLSPNRVEFAFLKRKHAILPVHLFGLAADSCRLLIGTTWRRLKRLSRRMVCYLWDVLMCQLRQFNFFLKLVCGFLSGQKIMLPNRDGWFKWKCYWRFFLLLS